MADDTWASFVTAHAAMARAFFESRTPRALRRRIDADDLLQETHRRLLPIPLPAGTARLAVLRETIQSVLIDAIRVATASRRDAQRETSRDSDLRAASEPRTPVTRPSVVARRREIRSALDSLSPADAEVLRLCDLHGHSVKEAAAVLDITPRQARRRLELARAKLRKRLADYEADGSPE